MRLGLIIDEDIIINNVDFYFLGCSSNRLNISYYGIYLTSIDTREYTLKLKYDFLDRGTDMYMYELVKRNKED